ncbi:cobQ/CobB/MinD/ParA nucleotide binding domain protein [Brucella rhizosphaerae]|uniref:CobQ/CobB/MinD/ParA nucleotide binding domain protein n=1 Tax=Brucella rhizosphaerae TaxID=571254 RepID=A0A256FS59_9HYPH|nr:cobQ/CobB/MinD/ParA nucleotide binding domain protein [Brucella rhizosphaerae]
MLQTELSHHVKLPYLHMHSRALLAALSALQAIIDTKKTSISRYRRAIVTLRISSVSGKGGAGKTTAVILTAGELALKNRRVLLIDADPRQNLAEWWKRCEAKDNVPASISLATALRQNNIEKLMASQEGNYDAILIDAPGVDSVVMDTIIDHSDIVITPIQPAQDEIKAVGEAAEAIATRTDVLDRSIPQAVLRTRITIVNRHLEEYRIIRPFVQNLSEHGYNSVLLDTELIERNCYREIRSGLGTLQMLEPSEPVLKARAEVNAFVEELEQLKMAQQRETING